MASMYSTTPPTPQILTPFSSPYRNSYYSPSKDELARVKERLYPSEHLFSLEDDPASLPRIVRIYLSLLAKTSTIDGQGTPESELWCASIELEQKSDSRKPVNPDAPLVTRARMERGIEILKARRAEGKGVFFKGFTMAQLRARPLYPFLPEGLPEKELQNMLPNPGKALVCTNVVLPIPHINPEEVPPALLHTVVGWLYSDFFPSARLRWVPRNEYDEDRDCDGPPYDMDAEYPDDDIFDEVKRDVHDRIERFYYHALQGFHRQQRFRWAHDRDTIARIVARPLYKSSAMLSY